MHKILGLVSLLLLLPLTTIAGSGQASQQPSIRLLLSEVQPGAMSADQYCTLVFADHRFHSEKASRHHGQDTDRKIYEGALSDDEWNTLGGILDNKELRELKVPQSVPPLVMQDTHPYTISIARDGNYQNMEFLTSKSLKPYEPQVKPLLQWWKSLRGRRMPPSNTPANARCSLDSSHGIFASP
jgi:hypothetical protein